MKIFFLLTAFLGVAAAVEETQRSTRKHRRTSRPSTHLGGASLEVRTPSGALEGYHVGTAVATRHESRSGLTELPAALVDAGLRHRRSSLVVPPGQSSAQDFYECQNANPAPEEADCQAIVDQLLSESNTMVVQQNACLTFVYQTCQGFFCALCSTLATTSSFVGNQLDSVNFLCVADGKAGAIVGESSPQWDAGFVRAGASLPSYDVC